MKIFAKLLSALTIIGFLFNSCEKNQIIQDDQTNQKIANQDATLEQNINWLKVNRNHLDQMNRKEIVQLNGELQREIYRILSPEKRKNLWIDKLAHLKTVVKTEKEFDFINKIDSIVDGLTFTESWNEKDISHYENILTKGMQELNWNRTFVIYAFGTLHDLDTKIIPKNDFFGMNETGDGGVIEGITHRMAPPPSCNCNWGWCPGSSCESISCEETTTGCSFLLLGPCDEKCK